MQSDTVHKIPSCPRQRITRKLVCKILELVGVIPQGRVPISILCKTIVESDGTKK